jgi:heme A synthase
MALAASVATWLLVTLGGVVRITGSGMGCGPDWPLCNGELVPLMDFPTFVEWSHRLAAAVVSLLVVAVAAHAWWPGRGDAWRPFRRLMAWAVGLLVVQVLLGAVTVWLELPPASVVLHLGTAMALLGVLVTGTARALAGRRRGGSGGDGRVGWWTAGAALAVVLLGALVANLGAAPACGGFPLCDGALLPSGGWRVQLHWGHRLAAYALVAWCLWLPFRVNRGRPDDGAARGWAWAAAGAAVLQLGAGAAMVTGGLPMELRVVHMAVGAALFAVLVALAAVLGRPRPPGAAAGRGPRPER